MFLLSFVFFVIISHSGILCCVLTGIGEQHEGIVSAPRVCSWTWIWASGGWVNVWITSSESDSVISAELNTTSTSIPLDVRHLRLFWWHAHLYLSNFCHLSFYKYHSNMWQCRSKRFLIPSFTFIAVVANLRCSDFHLLSVGWNLLTKVGAS